MKITVYQNHESNDEIRPVWLGIDFGMDGVPWTQKTLYVNVSVYDVRDMYDFMDDVIGCSIYLEELLADPEGKHLGIDLERLYDRLQQSIDPSIIERFIIQICDIQEVLEGAKEMFI